MIAEPSIQSVVHLVAPPSQMTANATAGRILPTVLCAKALKAKMVPQGKVIIVGDHTTARSANALGLAFDARISPVFHNPRFMARNLQSLVAPNTHIICWSDELFASASAICPSTELISTAPPLANRSPRGHTMIRVLDETDREAWTKRNRTAILDRDLAPLIDTFKTTYTRETLRARLGLDEHTICLGALSDCPTTTDARQFAFLLGLFTSVGYKIAGLIPSNAANTPNARRHCRSLRNSFRLIFTDDPIVTLLPAINAMFHSTNDQSGSASLIERLCENTDVPVIRVTHAEKRGLTRSPGVANSILDQLDAIVQTQKIAGKVT